LPEKISSEAQGVINQPAVNFFLDLRIKDLTYTNDLAGVRIASSLASAYPNIEIILNIAAKDAIIPSLSGEDPIKLKIELLQQNTASEPVRSQPQDTLEFDLMLISVEFEMPVTDAMAAPGLEHTLDRTTVRLLTVPRKPYISMTTTVNEVFGVVEDPKTPKEVIESLVSEFSSNTTIKYDSANQNKNKVPQLCVPPTTLYSAINYLDDTYGLFDGACAVFCKHDNELQVMNLSYRIKSSKDRLTIYHLSTSANPEDAIFKNLKDRTYYTYDNLQTTYVGNTKFAVIGNDINHIVLPSDSLYAVVQQDLTNICGRFGIIDQRKDIPVGAEIDHRKKYYILHGGVETQDTFANAMVAKKIFDLSRISFQLDRNIKLTYLMNIGRPVKLKTTTLEHKGLSGNYILFSTDVVLIRDGGIWTSTARLQLARTNRTIGQ